MEIFAAMHWHLPYLCVFQSRCYLECVSGEMICFQWNIILLLSPGEPLLLLRSQFSGGQEDKKSKPECSWPCARAVTLTSPFTRRPGGQASCCGFHYQRVKGRQKGSNSSRVLCLSCGGLKSGWGRFSPQNPLSTCAVMCFDNLCCRYSLCMNAKKIVVVAKKSC